MHENAHLLCDCGMFEHCPRTPTLGFVPLNSTMHSALDILLYVNNCRFFCCVNIMSLYAIVHHHVGQCNSIGGMHKAKFIVM